VTPYYADDLVTIYHGDCREMTVAAEAVVSDPPYGMGWDTDTTRFSGGEQGHKRGRVAPRIVGDDEPFDPTPWLAYDRVVLFGANHYANRLPLGTTLVWVKRNDGAFGTFLSDAEIAWMKGGHGVYCYRDFRRPGRTNHPTEKPEGLMRWVLGKVGGTGTVLDPYMGSGSTLVAAKSLGRHAIGIEIEERYCEIAATRCSQEVLGLAG
jgi:DNA modification methylase